MVEPHFDGRTYDHRIDGRRLKGQLQIIREYMLARAWQWVALDELERVTGYPGGSISARIRDLRKPKFGGYEVEGRRRKPQGGTWEYRVRPGFRLMP